MLFVNLEDFLSFQQKLIPNVMYLLNSGQSVDGLFLSEDLKFVEGKLMIVGDQSKDASEEFKSVGIPKVVNRISEPIGEEVQIENCLSVSFTTRFDNDVFFYVPVPALKKLKFKVSWSHSIPISFIGACSSHDFYYPYKEDTIQVSSLLDPKFIFYSGLANYRHFYANEEEPNIDFDFLKDQLGYFIDQTDFICCFAVRKLKCVLESTSKFNLIIEFMRLLKLLKTSN